MNRVNSLPATVRHAGRWVYWRGRLYYLREPHLIRAALKSCKPRKRFGIDAPIIVYQMSKVGSSTLHTSLTALDLDVPIYHVHFLNELDEIEASTRAAHAEPQEALGVIELGRRLRRQLDRAPDRAWNVITLVRAPIARDVSSFFQALDAYLPDVYENSNVSLTVLMQTFLERHYHGTADYWFDTQVKPVFGIDVYATPFPIEQGFATYQAGNIRMLLIRLEDLDRVAPTAFQQFFGLREFNLVRANQATDKRYAPLYESFRDQVRLPDSYTTEMTTSRYARHFYTGAELQREYMRWTEGA